MSVVRFGVSLEKELLEELDKFVEENEFANRSQAIRNLINKNLAEKKWEKDNFVAGSITLVFDHHKNDLQKNLTEIQHDYHHEILSAQHFHLDHDTCLEIIAVKGNSSTLTELANKLIAVKGIRHGKLTMSRAD
jgi:CopG family nickel-responsive transcriptional regulator